MLFSRKESDAEIVEKLIHQSESERYAERLSSFVKQAQRRGWFVENHGPDGVSLSKVRRWPTVLGLGVLSACWFKLFGLVFLNPLMGPSYWSERRGEIECWLLASGLLIPVILLTVFVKPRMRFVSRAELLEPGVLPEL